MESNYLLLIAFFLSCLFFIFADIRFSLVSIFVVTFSAGQLIPLWGRQPFFFLFLFVVLVFFVHTFDLRRYAEIEWTRFEKLVLIYTINGIIYLILARENILGQPEATELYRFVAVPMPAIFFFIVLFSLRAGHIKPEFLLKTVFVILSSVCILSLIYLQLTVGLTIEAGPQFLYVNANNFGALCASAFIFWVIYNPQHIFGRAVLAYINLSLLLGVALSQSRAAILSIIISLILFMFSGRWIRRAFFFIPIIIILFLEIVQYIPLGIAEKLSLMRSAYYAGDITLATSGRFAMWQAAINYMLDAPLYAWLFGNGVGTFEVSANLYHGIIDLQTHAHNHYLNELLIGGIWTLGLYLFMIGQLFYDCYNALGKKEDRLPSAVFFMMVSYAFCDLFGSRFSGNSLYIVFPIIALYYARYGFSRKNVTFH